MIPAYVCGYGLYYERMTEIKGINMSTYILGMGDEINIVITDLSLYLSMDVHKLISGRDRIQLSERTIGKEK